MYMYVCMYVCMYVYMYIYIGFSISTKPYPYIHIFGLARFQRPLSASNTQQMSSPLCVCVCVCVCVCT